MFELNYHGSFVHIPENGHPQTTNDNKLHCKSPQKKSSKH
jgi:hypothetical protein